MVAETVFIAPSERDFPIRLRGPICSVRFCGISLFWTDLQGNLRVEVCFQAKVQDLRQQNQCFEGDFPKDPNREFLQKNREFSLSIRERVAGIREA